MKERRAKKVVFLTRFLTVPLPFVFSSPKGFSRPLFLSLFRLTTLPIPTRVALGKILTAERNFGSAIPSFVHVRCGETAFG
jgi:hypothetical protein